MNKYLEKLARHLHVHKAERSKVRELIEGELSGRAVDAAKPKHKKRKHLEKVAIALYMYRCPVTGRQKWVTKKEDAPEGYELVKETYKKFNK